eukprot:536464-Pleurochrysis_carterae.AAC.1
MEASTRREVGRIVAQTARFECAVAFIFVNPKESDDRPVGRHLRPFNHSPAAVVAVVLEFGAFRRRSARAVFGECLLPRPGVGSRRCHKRTPGAAAVEAASGRLPGEQHGGGVTGTVGSGGGTPRARAGSARSLTGRCRVDIVRLRRWVDGGRLGVGLGRVGCSVGTVHVLWPRRRPRRGVGGGAQRRDHSGKQKIHVRRVGQCRRGSMSAFLVPPACTESFVWAH